MVANTSDELPFTTDKTPEEQFRFDDPLQRTIIGLVFIPICFTGLFGNSLVLLSVLVSRKLHTISNVFVVNLSIADLVVCMSLPSTIAQAFSPLDVRVGPDWLCALNAAVMFACIGVSVSTLASISLIRALIVTRPLAARFSRKMMTLWLTLVWLIPSTVDVLPQLLWGGELFGYDGKYGACMPKTSHPKIDLYKSITFLVSFPLPFLTIVASLVVIIINLKRHSSDLVKGNTKLGKSSKTKSTSKTVPVPVSSVTVAIEDNTTKLRLQRRQVQITKNMMMVVGVFFACIAPFFLIVVIPDTAPALPYLSLITYFNSCVNPIIYAKHPNFREIFLHILNRRWADIPKKSRFLEFFINR
ncbi:alpha-1A adrenergic receptor-like [Amphiura filiformis]|uniref:alpha-1A adrenergic receptor-like n=1 Tax=Amphiura filiformis TaxID=82378 RepID=UPI003B21522F